MTDTLHVERNAAMDRPPRVNMNALGQRYGLGRSASKIYGVARGVSIGGYGEALYENFASRDEAGRSSDAADRATLLRAVVYLGYKFDDHFVLNTELEYENAVVASDKAGAMTGTTVLVDGGLPIPGSERVSSREVADALLGVPDGLGFFASIAAWRPRISTLNAPSR